MALKAGQAKLKERNTNKKDGLSKMTNRLFLESIDCLTTMIDGVQQLDIVKFALPLDKISFHPILSAEGKHTNFFMSGRAASQPYLAKLFRCARRRFSSNSFSFSSIGSI